MYENRYEVMESHNTGFEYMVWDYYENIALCYCYLPELADEITRVFNKLEEYPEIE